MGGGVGTQGAMARGRLQGGKEGAKELKSNGGI